MTWMEIRKFVTEIGVEVGLKRKENIGNYVGFYI